MRCLSCSTARPYAVLSRHAARPWMLLACKQLQLPCLNIRYTGSVLDMVRLLYAAAQPAQG